MPRVPSRQGYGMPAAQPMRTPAAPSPAYGRPNPFPAAAAAPSPARPYGFPSPVAPPPKAVSPYIHHSPVAASGWAGAPRAPAGVGVKPPALSESHASYGAFYKPGAYKSPAQAAPPKVRNVSRGVAVAASLDEHTQCPPPCIATNDDAGTRTLPAILRCLPAWPQAAAAYGAAPAYGAVPAYGKPYPGAAGGGARLPPVPAGRAVGGVPGLPPAASQAKPSWNYGAGAGARAAAQAYVQQVRQAIMAQQGVAPPAAGGRGAPPPWQHAPNRRPY